MAYIPAGAKPRLKKRRRVRVCNCPYCGHLTRLEPARDQIALSTCLHLACLRVFQNHLVTSWLVEPENAP